MGGADLSEARLERADLRGTHLEGANLSHARLERAVLREAHLEGANLREASATEAVFDGAFLDRTDLQHIVFGRNHPAMHDGTDSLRLPRRDRWLTWARLRGIGAFPLFQVSYAALAASILTIVGIGWFNDTRPITVLRDDPIQIPERTLVLLASSIFLAVGSTLYRLKCPGRVQEFSEVQWVEQHRYPRLQYLAESLRRPWQIETAIITGIGGVLALYLVGDRVYVAPCATSWQSWAYRFGSG